MRAQAARARPARGRASRRGSCRAEDSPLHNRLASKAYGRNLEFGRRSKKQISLRDPSGFSNGLPPSQGAVGADLSRRRTTRCAFIKAVSSNSAATRGARPWRRSQASSRGRSAESAAGSSSGSPSRLCETGRACRAFVVPGVQQLAGSEEGDAASTQRERSASPQPRGERPP
jgi:hypothetical protein